MLTILSDSRFYRKPFYVGKQVKYDKNKKINNNIQLNNIQCKIFNRSNAISNGMLRHSLYLSHFKWAFDYISRQLVLFFFFALLLISSLAVKLLNSMPIKCDLNENAHVSAGLLHVLSAKED